MGQISRQSEILELIQSGKCHNVNELAEVLYASGATIRRDLHELENQGFIKLAYGNVIPLTYTPKGIPLSFRYSQSKSIKKILAEYAAKLIPANSTVMLDSSSSSLYMSEYIHPKKDITVFTNGIKNALKLCERGITVYLIGGKIDSINYVADGLWAKECVRSIDVDYLFFSSRGMDENGVISGATELGVDIRKEMIAHSKYQYFICPGEKTGIKSTFELTKADQITGVITDVDLSHIKGINCIKVDKTLDTK